MNKHLVAIFTATLDNKIVCHETNLKAFQALFKTQEPTICNYQALYRRFVKADYFALNVGGKEYHFQKLS